METERPEHVKCIAHTNQVNHLQTWCGKRQSLDFYLLGLDHAVYNAMNNGRLLACPQCVAAAFAALRPEEKANVDMGPVSR